MYQFSVKLGTIENSTQLLQLITNQVPFLKCHDHLTIVEMVNPDFCNQFTTFYKKSVTISVNMKKVY